MLFGYHTSCNVQFPAAPSSATPPRATPYLHYRGRVVARNRGRTGNGRRASNHAFSPTRPHLPCCCCRTHRSSRTTTQSPRTRPLTGSTWSALALAWVAGERVSAGAASPSSGATRDWETLAVLGVRSKRPVSGLHSSERAEWRTDRRWSGCCSAEEGLLQEVRQFVPLNSPLCSPCPAPSR